MMIRASKVLSEPGIYKAGDTGFYIIVAVKAYDFDKRDLFAIGQFTLEGELYDFRSGTEWRWPETNGEIYNDCPLEKWELVELP